jgi:uncharacterized protein YndB with AHSA1/START domain
MASAIPSTVAVSIAANAAIAAATAGAIEDRGFRVRRRIAAPRARVFAAFTDPAQVALWWGPAGFRNTVHAMDVRAGGSWRYTMHGPDGTDWPNRVDYTAVRVAEHLAYRHGDEDADGTFRPMFDVTIDFADDGAAHTVVTMTMLFPDRASRDRVFAEVDAEKGAYENMDRLETFVGDGFVLTHRFAAPRERVWRAWSEPAQLARWWGPAGRTLTVESLDFRVGGRFHFRMGDGDDAWYAVFTYREIEPPRRLVYDSAFCDAAMTPQPAPFAADFPLNVRYEIDFDEADGITTLHLRGEPAGAGPAQMAFFRGLSESMRSGFGATFEQLDRLLRTTET